MGSDSAEVNYAVYLGQGILVDDAINNYPRLFISSNPNDDHYDWNFTCDTSLDLTPPYITAVYPNPNTTTPKNTVIQISFSEPVNPIGLQGSMQSSSPFDGYLLNNDESNGLYLTNSSTNILPQGSWNLVNNFQTLEFTPSEQCGKNVCGDPVYCLPVCTLGSVNCPNANYKIILKTASTTGSGFVDSPFTGIEDLAGNALDGNNDNFRENPTTTLPIFDNWKSPDNYIWGFSVSNEMDLTPPYLVHVEPSIVESFVAPQAPWVMKFDKQMRVDSFYDIDIQEFPDPSQTNGVPLYKDPRVQAPDYELVNVMHGDFLKVDKKIYMPIATSSIQDSHFNCFYPGLGPETHSEIQNKTVVPTLDCTVNGDTKTNCCAVSDTDTGNFCCNGAATSSNGGIQRCFSDGQVNYYTQ